MTRVPVTVRASAIATDDKSKDTTLFVMLALGFAMASALLWMSIHGIATPQG